MTLNPILVFDSLSIESNTLASICEPNPCLAYFLSIANLPILIAGNSLFSLMFNLLHISFLVYSSSKIFNFIESVRIDIFCSFMSI